MFYNEWEIQTLVERARENERLAPYAKFLADWMETVNGNSDGWAYWKAGRRCTVKLVDLLKQGTTLGCELPTVQALNKALTPIKSCATRHKLPKPELSVQKTRNTPRVGTTEAYLDRARDFSQRMRAMEG